MPSTELHTVGLFLLQYGVAVSITAAFSFQLHHGPSIMSDTVFGRAQSRYKRSSLVSLEEIKHEWIDFAQPDERIKQNVQMSEPLFEIPGVPGFLYLPQVLHPDLQLLLAQQALTTYCEPPHATNMDPQLQPEDYRTPLFQKWKRNRKANGEKRNLSKLSWATLGYQYDWSRRSYHAGARSEMPNLLSTIAAYFGQFAGVDDLVASAAIVNFYSIKSRMGGHRDDLEEALEQPIVSLSLGLPAIFLLGGATKDDKVLPILVRPGDVMIMGGPSRLYFHGMARLVIDEIPKPLPASTRNGAAVSLETLREFSGRSLLSLETQDSDVELFLRSHRININLRQVYHSETGST